MLRIPDQVRDDDKRTFHETVLFNEIVMGDEITSSLLPQQQRGTTKDAQSNFGSGFKLRHPSRLCRTRFSVRIPTLVHSSFSDTTVRQPWGIVKKW